MDHYAGPYPERWKYPYIGVTGFLAPDQVREIVHLLADRYEDQDGTLKPGRLLMIGVLASDKTLRGETNSHPNVFPPVSEIQGIFEAASSVGDAMTMRTLHYNTHDPATLDDQLIRLYNLAGGYIVSAVQLNVAWPYPDCLVKYRQEVTNTHRIILQLGNKAMQGLSPEKIARKVSAYGPLITDVLVDPSAGAGILCDPKEYFPIIDAILQETQGAIGIGYAGGLSCGSVLDLEVMYQRFPQLSVDAQGRLQDENGFLDVHKSLHYVTTAIYSLRRARD